MLGRRGLMRRASAAAGLRRGGQHGACRIAQLEVGRAARAQRQQPRQRAGREGLEGGGGCGAGLRGQRGGLARPEEGVDLRGGAVGAGAGGRG